MSDPQLPSPASPDADSRPRDAAASRAPAADPSPEWPEPGETPTLEQDGPPEAVNDTLPIPNLPEDGEVTPDDLNGEAPD